MVRDEASQHFAEQHFDCEVRLCPDMACYIGAVEPEPARLPVLAMLRNDQEKMAGRADRSAWPEVPVEDWIAEPKMPVRIARLRGAASALFDASNRRLRMLDAVAGQRFRRGTRQLSRGRAIVTDRLHVHIVSLLLGRPHAVLDNSYGKVRNFMAAFSGGSDLSYLATSLDDGIAWAREQARRGADA
jgi:pyruvyl transferase EpsO